MGSILSLAIFFLAIVIHEYAHGQVAFWLGDRTAFNAGRVTLNPLAHIDIFGTIILPLILIKTNSPVVFGWAKPVPINYWGLSNPKKDIIWVGLAGPLANILLSIILGLFLKIAPGLPASLSIIITAIIITNLFLAAFNLIPIPPLDGSRVLFGILPQNLAGQYIRLERYGFIILIGLLYLFPNLTDVVIMPFIRVFLNIFKINAF